MNLSRLYKSVCFRLWSCHKRSNVIA